MNFVKFALFLVVIMLLHSLRNISRLANIDLISIFQDIKHRPVTKIIIFSVAVAGEFMIGYDIEVFFGSFGIVHIIAPVLRGCTTL